MLSLSAQRDSLDAERITLLQGVAQNLRGIEESFSSDEWLDEAQVGRPDPGLHSLYFLL